MARLSRRLTILLVFAGVFTAHLVARQYPGGIRKASDFVSNKYTSVGNIALTVTNFGTIGTRNGSWPNQPSCEYPRGSRIEHVYQGGLWVGALRKGQILVSTGANDRSTSSQRFGEGLEFSVTGRDSIVELSYLNDDRPSTARYTSLAVSHQDFVCDYTDRYTRVPGTNDSIYNHTPILIDVHQESYAWNFPFADFFVILRYVVKNVSPDTLDSVYVGFWDNAVVRNTNYVRPGTSGYFNYTGHGYDAAQRMAYSFDFSGQPGGPPADSYIGVRLLGTTPFPANVASVDQLSAQTFFSAWNFRQAIDVGFPEFASPTDDYNSTVFLSRYSRMTQSIPQNRIDILRTTPQNATYLVSTGPFSRLLPDSTIEFVVGVVCAKKDGNDAANRDTPEQKATLYSNAKWAQQAYNGEDVNGNNFLDPGEDIARRDSVSPTEFGLRYTPDSIITRYLLPTPPRRPKVRMEVESQSVALYWDRSTSEESVDPISGLKDFEGYKVYRSNVSADFLDHDNFLLDLSIAGDFDRADDSIGYNTGFSKITLDSATTFPGDTVQYWYRFPPQGVSSQHLNGFQYLYAVTAYDQGDPINNVPVLESTRQLQRVFPGTLPTSDPSVEVGVYPNPYYVNAYWDGSRERLRKIYFYNLPQRATLTIFTLAGDIVTELDHDASVSNGDNIEWFNQFGARGTPAQFTGGEHAWDLITRYDQAIATGLYLFTVVDKDTGTIKRGKFMIVK